ncbi:hypothetical protein HPB50_000656 [Hyalomma asiaticum]|uniref:Uncharacterized protein n=1 Tax=Hyalomma asiaticum TaxID=266040 RepID=A0ACB7T7I8_HYAAI|nr:hypothetical protein HPB50_000656 [Hyalomma asiaticum]
MMLSPTRSYLVRKPFADRGPESKCGPLFTFFLAATVLSAMLSHAAATNDDCHPASCGAWCEGKGFDTGKCSTHRDYSGGRREGMCRCAYILGRAPKEMPQVENDDEGTSH